MKFKVGDKIKIIEVDEVDTLMDIEIGMIGEIIELDNCIFWGEPELFLYEVSVPTLVGSCYLFEKQMEVVE